MNADATEEDKEAAIYHQKVLHVIYKLIINNLSTTFVSCHQKLKLW